MQAPLARTIWRFGVFELDAEAGELRRVGVVVRLQPQALRVLVALLERPGAVVSRLELRRLLWGEATFVGFDRSLNFCLSSLRRALRDDARNPRFVETLPGRGYRFIAPVSSSVPQSAPRVAAPAAARPARMAAGIVVATALLLALSPPPRRVEAHDPVALALYAEARP